MGLIAIYNLKKKEQTFNKQEIKLVKLICFGILKTVNPQMGQAGRERQKGRGEAQIE